jgi:L-rhamnose mutarotase
MDRYNRMRPGTGATTPLLPRPSAGSTLRYHFMIRKAFVMQLHPGQETEYARRHNPIWPALQAVLKSHGVRSYSIYLHPGTLQLFAYAEIEDEARWRAIADSPECRRWWAHMRDLMDTNADNSPVAVALTEAFHLE